MNSLHPTVENAFRKQFGDKIKTQVPLAAYTTLRIGGPADFLLEAAEADDLIAAFRLAREYEIPFYFFGGCSNVLIHDDGLRGLVIINKTRRIEWHDNYTLSVAGGYNLDTLVTELSERGWGDLSFAAGIPGTLGGALVGGAGAFGHLVYEYLTQSSVLRRDGSVTDMTTAELGIQYRTSEAKKRGDIILMAEMGPFTPQSAEALLAECKRIRDEREVKHPSANLPSAGSFFKNLPPETPGGHRVPAGRFLDAVGAKQMRVGDAGVFEKHANIIVNYGNATCAQINELADRMAEKVKERFGVTLEREVQYLS